MQLSLFDLHCDTACEMRAQHQPLRRNTLAVSLEKATAFRQYIQVMAFWTDHRLSDEEGWERMKAIRRNLLNDPDVSAGNAEVCASLPPRKNGTFLLFGVEDARILNGKPERVDELFDMGVRILTPLWSGATCIGGSHDTPEGLTEFGKLAIARAIRHGMIPDISHASERSADDIFGLAAEVRRPVIASHSNAYRICPVSRNLRDGQIRDLLNSGGVIGLNLYTHFLSTGGNASPETIRRHLEYFLEHGAETQLCLGCDMDGAELPPDLPDLAALPRLADYLLGFYPESLIRGLFFENAYHFAERFLAPSATI